jgi:hypothetical protein
MSSTKPREVKYKRTPQGKYTFYNIEVKKLSGKGKETSFLH